MHVISRHRFSILMSFLNNSYMNNLVAYITTPLRMLYLRIKHDRVVQCHVVSCTQYGMCVYSMCASWYTTHKVIIIIIEVWHIVLSRRYFSKNEAEGAGGVCQAYGKPNVFPKEVFPYARARRGVYGADAPSKLVKCIFHIIIIIHVFALRLIYMYVWIVWVSKLVVTLQYYTVNHEGWDSQLAPEW